MIFDYSTTRFDFTMIANYDKLHYTELFNQMSITLEEITSKFTINSLSVTQSSSSDTPSSLNIIPTTQNFETDTARSYKVIANIHSLSIVTPMPL